MTQRSASVRVMVLTIRFYVCDAASGIRFSWCPSYSRFVHLAQTVSELGTEDRRRQRTVKARKRRRHMSFSNLPHQRTVGDCWPPNDLQHRLVWGEEQEHRCVNQKREEPFPARKGIYMWRNTSCDWKWPFGETIIAKGPLILGLVLYGKIESQDFEIIKTERGTFLRWRNLFNNDILHTDFHTLFQKSELQTASQIGLVYSVDFCSRKEMHMMIWPKSARKHPKT